MSEPGEELGEYINSELFIIQQDLLSVIESVHRVPIGVLPKLKLLDSVAKLQSLMDMIVEPIQKEGE